MALPAVEFRPSIGGPEWYREKGQDLIKLADRATAKMYLALEAGDITLGSRYEEIARHFKLSAFDLWSAADSMEEAQKLLTAVPA